MKWVKFGRDWINLDLARSISCIQFEKNFCVQVSYSYDYLSNDKLLLNELFKTQKECEDYIEIRLQDGWICNGVGRDMSEEIMQRFSGESFIKDIVQDEQIEKLKRNYSDYS